MAAGRFFPRLASLALAGAVLLQACNRGPLPVTPLKASDLPADTFEIRADRDTTLRTQGGASIQIPAGSVQPGTGTTGQIVVREAYTPGRMLRGGLVTLSGSDILSSGGMIDIEPGADTKPALAKAIILSMPPAALRPGMQLWQDSGSRHNRFEWNSPVSRPGQGTAPVPAFGWTGAGALIRDLPGFENSRVLAKFTGGAPGGISVYLILPEDGIILEGGPAVSGGGSYAFYRNNGTVPLRPGRPAIIAGVQQAGKTWLYAETLFTARPDQELQLEMKQVTQEELYRRLDSLQRPGF